MYSILIESMNVLRYQKHSANFQFLEGLNFEVSLKREPSHTFFLAKNCWTLSTF